VELYAAIKGVAPEYIQEAASNKLEEVGLSEKDSDRLSSNYSGGMKRRLSLACATIGQPEIVFLDECSTGVDPVARREIWQLVSDLVSDPRVPQNERTSVILTTHSMDECEALCPRLAIMANGKLRCIGSAQHLKSRFGLGYQVEMRVQAAVSSDADFKQTEKVLKEHAEDEKETFDLGTAKLALFKLTENEFLSEKLSEKDEIGYMVYKDATAATGVSLDDLAIFATNELRMAKLAKFIQENYADSILRERQDSKCRYEVSSKKVSIADIFSKIEEQKGNLMLIDYGVSQTSLEQVFNKHAAEAEKLKLGRLDS